MKLAPVFFIGFSCGIAAAALWQAASKDPEPAPNEPVGMLARPAAARRADLPAASRPVRRGMAETQATAGLQERLRAAVATPLPPDDPAVPGGVAPARLSDWLAANGIDPDGEILASLTGFIKETGGDPLVPGSAFDRWLQERLDPPAREAWALLQQEHVADLVERRSNRLLSSMQAEIPLSPAE